MGGTHARAFVNSDTSEGPLQSWIDLSKNLSGSLLPSFLMDLQKQAQKLPRTKRLPS